MFFNYRVAGINISFMPHFKSFLCFFCHCLALPCSIYTMKKKDQEEVYLKMNFKKNVTIFLSHLHHMMLSMFSPVSDPE